MAHDERDDWKRDLTPEQVATVERAAKAAWERDGGDIWHLESAGVRDHACADQLAALRDVGVIPPARVKTRGEKAAETYTWATDDNDFGVGMGSRVAFFKLTQMASRAPVTLADFRDALAGVIDAQLATAFEDAARIVDEYGFPAVSAKIRALAKAAQPRELREQDGAKRDGAGRGGG